MVTTGRFCLDCCVSRWLVPPGVFQCPGFSGCKDRKVPVWWLRDKSEPYGCDIQRFYGGGCHGSPALLKTNNSYLACCSGSFVKSSSPAMISALRNGSASGKSTRSTRPAWNKSSSSMASWLFCLYSNGLKIPEECRYRHPRQWAAATGEGSEPWRKFLLYGCRKHTDRGRHIHGRGQKVFGMSLSFWRNG